MNLFLVSIPETFAYLFFTFALFGVRWRGRWKKHIGFVLLYAALTYVLFQTSIPTQVRVTLNILVHIFLMNLIYHFSWRLAIFMSLSRSVIQILIETIIFYTATILLSLPDHDLLYHPVGSLVTAWFIDGLILGLSLLLIKKQVSLKKCLNIRNPTYLKYFVYIMGAFILQVIVNSLGSVYIIEENVQTSHYLLFMAFVNILFIGVIVFLFYTFARQLEQESVEKTENVYLENIDHLVISLRSQRHDYLNHFQVISELVHQQAYDALNQYLKDLNIEIKNNDSLLQLNHVPLAALLKAKMEIAQVNQIRMEVDIQTSIPKLDIKPYELVQMLGNLIDNAIDEEIKAPPSERFIKVAIHTMFDSLLTILVHNKNSWIQPETVKYLFQEGYTTKKDHRGIGLAAVKRVITKYGGHVEVESSEQEGTTFFLFITYSSR